ncbi:MAG: metal ABC transporter permease [Thermoleophilaceae bacterium]
MPAPFDVAYMERALLAGVLLAAPLGLLGTWVVVRGLAFFSHAVGVATFPGVVVGLGVPALGPFAGSVLAAGLFTGTVSWLERDHRLRGGVVTGITLAAALALGGLMLTTVFQVSAPVESVLFGSLLAISEADVIRCVAIAAIAAIGLVLISPGLAAATFDREWSRPAGARPERGDAVLLVLLALTVVVALPTTGSLLVSGLLTVPAATARLLTDRLGVMQLVAVALCAVETVAGLGLARELDVPPGAAVASLAGAVFALTALGAAFCAWRVAGVTRAGSGAAR